MWEFVTIAGSLCCTRMVEMANLSPCMKSGFSGTVMFVTWDLNAITPSVEVTGGLRQINMVYSH